MLMTVSLLIISFSWTMIFSISVWTSSSFNSVPLLQIAQRRQHAEQIAALTEEIEELRSRQAMILHNLDCKTTAKLSALAAIWTSRKKCRSGWRHREKALHSSFPSTQNSTLKLRIRFSGETVMLFASSVPSYDRSSQPNKYRRYTANAMLMIRQSRLQKKS